MIEPNGTSLWKKSSRTCSVTLSSASALETAASGATAVLATPSTAASTPPATCFAMVCAPRDRRRSGVRIGLVAGGCGWVAVVRASCTISIGTPIPPIASDAPRAQVAYFFLQFREASGLHRLNFSPQLRAIEVVEKPLLVGPLRLQLGHRSPPVQSHLFARRRPHLNS